MSSLPMQVALMLGETIVKVIPITFALAAVFTVLEHLWACNAGAPWWRKREIVTDICYWFFVPVFARTMRIGLLIVGASLVFNIHDADELIAFYDNGHGPLSLMPLWARAALFWSCPTSCCTGCTGCSTAAGSGSTTRSITPRRR